MILTVLVSGCAGSASREEDPSTLSSTTSSTTASTTSSTTSPATSSTTSTTVPPSTTTTVYVPRYVFPFIGRTVSYPTGHHTYQAVDVFGCGATVIAPTDGVVQETRDVDLWSPDTNNPAHRGGRYVSLIGDDGVRYYFAHLAEVDAVAGQRVAPGDVLGVMGQSGDARLSVCHTHLGISRPCPGKEWQVRRGEIWPQPYLDDWRKGIPTSPAPEVAANAVAHPTTCDDAVAAPHAAEA